MKFLPCNTERKTKILVEIILETFFVDSDRTKSHWLRRLTFDVRRLTFVTSQKFSTFEVVTEIQNKLFKLFCTWNTAQDLEYSLKARNEVKTSDKSEVVQSIGSTFVHKHLEVILGPLKFHEVKFHWKLEKTALSSPTKMCGFSSENVSFSSIKSSQF